nr:hypothetical protein [Acetobacter conturbans]
MGLLVSAPVSVALEATGAGYTRQSIAFTATGDGRRTLSVSPSCSFGYATASWGLITGLALFVDNTADAQPLIAWSVPPRSIATGQTYSVSSDALSLLMQTDGFFSSGDRVGMSDSGAEIIARQPVAISHGILTAAVGGSAAASGEGSVTISQLNLTLSQLLQGLPTTDPGDGTSLWLNANLLALSTKS